jgi:hypothetical protein
MPDTPITALAASRDHTRLKQRRGCLRRNHMEMI